MPFFDEMNVHDDFNFEEQFANEIIVWDEQRINLEKTSYLFPPFFYKHFIDNILGIWLCHPDPQENARLFKSFQDDINSWKGLT